MHKFLIGIFILSYSPFVLAQVPMMEGRFIKECPDLNDKYLVENNDEIQLVMKKNQKGDLTIWATGDNQPAPITGKKIFSGEAVHRISCTKNILKYERDLENPNPLNRIAAMMQLNDKKNLIITIEDTMNLGGVKRILRRIP